MTLLSKEPKKILHLHNIYVLPTYTTIPFMQIQGGFSREFLGFKNCGFLNNKRMNKYCIKSNASVEIAFEVHCSMGENGVRWGNDIQNIFISWTAAHSFHFVSCYNHPLILPLFISFHNQVFPFHATISMQMNIIWCMFQTTFVLFLEFTSFPLGFSRKLLRTEPSLLMD